LHSPLGKGEVAHAGGWPSAYIRFMDYQVYPPDASLAVFVKCFWTLEAPATPVAERQRIVPDGCMEMIFHYGDPYRQFLPDGSSVIQPSAFVFGQITSPLEIVPTGASGIFAIRFHPDGFTPFATLPHEQLQDVATPLPDLFGNRGITFQSAMLAAVNAQQRITIAGNFLQEWLMSTQAADLVARSAVQALLQANGQITVDELSLQLHTHRRQLERKFSAAIGMSPKQLSKIIRLQTALKKLSGLQYESLTALAHESGYYDQAHFIKDFREFTGMSPKQFFADNLRMSAFFIGTE
jgi:AraC-like DNA-binding protein